jgi:hypothetical protein
MDVCPVSRQKVSSSFLATKVSEENLISLKSLSYKPEANLKTHEWFF